MENTAEGVWRWPLPSICWIEHVDIDQLGIETRIKGKLG